MPDAQGLPTDVYEAVVARFTARGLDASFNGGLIVAEEIPGTDFPYAVMDPMGEPVISKTNNSRYKQPSVQISVYDRTFHAVKSWIQQVEAALLVAPLAFSPTVGWILLCLPGTIRYQEESNFWRAMIDCDIMTASPYNRNPA